MPKKVIPAAPQAAKKKQKELPRVDEALMKPGKYEVTKDHTFDIDIYLKKFKNRWIIMEGTGRGVIKETVTMRLWGYDEMVGLKKKATAYDSQKRTHIVDNDFLNRLKVQSLLISWTFSKDNPRLKIWHQNDVLTDESWAAFKLLQTNISQYIINQMNAVYEYNG